VRLRLRPPSGAEAAGGADGAGESAERNVGADATLSGLKIDSPTGTAFRPTGSDFERVRVTTFSILILPQ